MILVKVMRSGKEDMERYKFHLYLFMQLLTCCSIDLKALMFLFRHQVYKGFLSSGETVAIKRENIGSLQGPTKFTINDLELLSRIHHRNVVGLIGFCFEKGEHILVYEYMPNGTLRECLIGQTAVNMD